MPAKKPISFASPKQWAKLEAQHEKDRMQLCNESSKSPEAAQAAQRRCGMGLGMLEILDPPNDLFLSPESDE